jgi:hypothetical protein
LLLILLILSSVFPAIKIHCSPGVEIHDALVSAHNGEIIVAVHLESLLTIIAILANSPES